MNLEADVDGVGKQEVASQSKIWGFTMEVKATFSHDPPVSHPPQHPARL